MAMEPHDEAEVQLLVVPEGKLEEAQRAIRKLFRDDDEGDDGDVGPEPDPVFVPDTSSATGCRRTPHHDIHCSDDTQDTGAGRRALAVTSDFGGRDVPFVMRVAAEWIEFSDADGVDDGAVAFRDRAALTGTLDVTSGGRDVEVSDIGLSR